MSTKRHTPKCIDDAIVYVEHATGSGAAAAATVSVSANQYAVIWRVFANYNGQQTASETLTIENLLGRNASTLAHESTDIVFGMTDYEHLELDTVMYGMVGEDVVATLSAGTGDGYVTVQYSIYPAYDTP